jgi:hypothetical protein
MSEPLETDRVNMAEIHAFYLTRAVSVYNDRRREGYNLPTAHTQACAYLRRKTGWDAPIAQGALDCALRDNSNAE